MRNKIRRVFTARSLSIRRDASPPFGTQAALFFFVSPAFFRACSPMLTLNKRLYTDATLSPKQLIPFHGTRVEGRKCRLFRYRTFVLLSDRITELIISYLKRRENNDSHETGRVSWKNISVDTCIILDICYTCIPLMTYKLYKSVDHMPLSCSSPSC